MAIKNFIPTVWSENLYSELDRQYIAVKHCNRDFEGDIRAKGNTVKLSVVFSDVAEKTASFYSEDGKELAQVIQTQLRVSLDPDNHRQAKANDTYYMLKKTDATIVIVECGFLSNPEEAALLKSEEYQDRVAWNIHLGVMQYLNRQQNG